ncbi:MAG: hypothetical protein A4E19_19355 [Nitrospira sp. SG-bin1]|nr:MAG: hypothetical protein A4E19_19355 [Nitrospira sp. SG-bin1]
MWNTAVLRYAQSISDPLSIQRAESLGLLDNLSVSELVLMATYRYLAWFIVTGSLMATNSTHESIKP